MPKGKTATHEKLVPIVKQEFLEYGYEKASVNHIAELVGMSAAGLYRHYKDKEDMFAFLEDETLTAFDRVKALGVAAAILLRYFEAGANERDFIRTN